MYIERTDTYGDEARRFRSGENKKGVIFFSGKYISFLNDLDPEILLTPEQAESFFIRGKALFEKQEQEQGRKVEDKVIFNLLFQMVLTAGGEVEVFCYKPTGLLPVLPYCFYRAGEVMKECKKLQEGDIVALSTGYDLDFPVSIEPDRRSLSRFIIFEIKKNKTLFAETPNEMTEVEQVPRKSYFGKILTAISLLLFIAGYILLNSRGDAPPRGQDEELMESRSVAVMMNNIDQDLSLIDRRIAEGKYSQALEIIRKWKAYFAQEPQMPGKNDADLQQRLRQLDHFESLLSVTDEEEI